MSWTPLNIAIAILGISALVVVHETGHYLAARAFGMRVLRYSIGLGPALWKYQPKGSPTIFQVCAIPLLAYVQIDGMNPTEKIDPDDPGLYPNKSVFARIVTIFAGPFANYLCASILIFGLGLVGGYPDRVTLAPNEIGHVSDDLPAAAAGLRSGDRILEAGGKPLVTARGDDEERRRAVLTNLKRLGGINNTYLGEPIEYVVQRGERRLTVTLRPTEDPKTGRAVSGVMIGSRSVYTTVPVGTAAWKAVERPFAFTIGTFEAIAHLVRIRSTEGVTSVVGMTEMLADSIETAPQEYVSMLIALSVALGLFNLLPIPALDGGRLAFLGFELITRRRANEKVEAVVHTVGLIVLLGLLALVMARDVMKLT